MRVLLDTCVLSDFSRSAPNPALLEFLRDFHATDVFLSVLSLGEIAKGVALIADGRRKRALETWFQRLEADYTDRMLRVDLDTAQIWGELTAAAQKKGRSVPAIDGLIAATAIRHGLHVATRNVKDFDSTGAMLVNPWER